MIDDVDVNFSKLQIHDPEGGYRTIEEFNTDHDVVSTKTMKIAYLFEGAEVSYQLYEKRKQLQIVTLSTTFYYIAAFTLLFILTGGYCVFNKSARVTKSIIHLYETLGTMQVQSTGSQSKPVLSYKAATQELNELHRTFNKVIKATIMNQADEECE